MIEIKVRNRGRQPLPVYATEQSAGMDLRADIDEPVVLHSMERRLIGTGLYMALPEGYEAQVRPRSGLALKQGVHMVIARHEQSVFAVVGELDDTERGEGGYGHTGVK